MRCCDKKVAIKKGTTSKVTHLQPNSTLWATKASGYSPPPSYSSLLDRIHHNKVSDSLTDGVKQIINGREYKVIIDSNGSKQLIPLRVPSAALFTYFTYNN